MCVCVMFVDVRVVCIYVLCSEANVKISTIKKMIPESSKLAWINLTLKIKDNMSISNHYPTQIQGNIHYTPPWNTAI